MKTAGKPLHPPFARMVMDSLHEHDGHCSLPFLRKHMVAKYTLPHGWEKRLNSAVKMLLHKKQLVHVAGHAGTFRLSKSMSIKEEKRVKRLETMKAKAAKPAPKKVSGPKAKAMKAKPAKKASAPKKAKKA